MVKKLEEMFKLTPDELEGDTAKKIEYKQVNDITDGIAISSGCIACNNGGGCNRKGYRDDKIKYNE